MITTTLLILLLVLIFSGIGLLFPWSNFRRSPSFEAFLQAFWTGWAIVIGFLQIWHFFFPVSTVVFILFLIVSLLGWGINGRGLRPFFRDWFRPASLGLAALAIVPALMVANHVMFVPAHFDHGLYHLQTVKWYSTYPIVPGLGNLHHRLAFNNSSLLTAALLNAGPLIGRSYYLSNTLLAYVLILQCAFGVFALLRRPATIRKTHLYYALMLPPVLWQVSTTHLPGYSPDVPVFVLQAVLAGELIRLFEPGVEKETFYRQAIYIALLTVTGVTVKLSFAVFAALILAAGLVAWWRRRFPGNVNLRGGLSILGIAAVWILPWLGRNVILSGYLLYPSTIISFPVLWRMPGYLADPVTYVISTWARTLSNTIEYTGDLAWFFHWAKYFVFEARQAFVITLIVGCVDILLFTGLRKRAAFDGESAALFGISMTGLVAWFVVAPDYRFSGALFWIGLVSTLMFAYTTLTSSRLISRAFPLGFVLLLALFLVISPNHFSNNLSLKLLVNPVPEPALAEEMRSPAQAVQHETLSGLLVYSPPNKATDCWNLPLPCTPTRDFLEYLRLIDPQDMSKGFYIPQ